MIAGAIAFKKRIDDITNGVESDDGSGGGGPLNRVSDAALGIYVGVSVAGIAVNILLEVYFCFVKRQYKDDFFAQNQNANLAINITYNQQ